MKALIFGALGSIGNYIFQQFTNDKIETIGTTTSLEKVTDKIIFVNKDNLDNLLNIDNLDIVIWAHGYNFNDNISIIEEQFVVSDDDCSDCAICMESRENDKFCQLNCQHCFCAVCIQTILHLPRTFHCPLCRERVDTIKVVNTDYIN